MEDISETEDRMHGSIFVFLKRFVEANYDHSTWLNLLEQAGISRQSYEMQEMYPTRELNAIVQLASDATGVSIHTLQEKFGEFLVPDLLLIYKNYIDPSWKTLDMLYYTEAAMHAAVRKEDSRTSPPILNISKVSDKLLIIDYFSKRKMAALAVGIIKGIASHYDESEKITVEPTTPFDNERVQIKVHFS